MKSRTRVGPLASLPEATPPLAVDALLDDPGVEILLCCGSGGVGKTTTAAALALRAAERGRRVVVLTIDPARRLAQSLGIENLDNTPRPVVGVEGTGSLDAMMLDMKRTFDEVVLSQASPEKAKAILENPFYVALSSSFAGTQEYMAMEKLGQVHRDAHRDGTYDLVVVDTPPSRSALDFLDSPERLSSFLDGRFLRLLLAPAKGPAKLLTAGFGVVSAVVTKILGGQMLSDLQVFVAAFDTLFGGFRARAEQTYALLKDERTRFVVVAAPEADALREADFFVDRLAEDAMPLAGLVVNRVAHVPVPDLSAESATAASERLLDSGSASGSDSGSASGSHEAGTRTAAGLLSLHAERSRLHEAQQRLISRFGATHPEVPVARVRVLPTDVHDLAGLRTVGALLAENAPTSDNATAPEG